MTVTNRAKLDPNDPIVIVCVGRPKEVYWDPCHAGHLQTLCPIMSGCDTGYTEVDQWALPDRDIEDIGRSIKKLVDDGFRVNIRVPQSKAAEYFNKLKYTPGRDP